MSDQDKQDKDRWETFIFLFAGSFLLLALFVPIALPLLNVSIALDLWDFMGLALLSTLVCYPFTRTSWETIAGWVAALLIAIALLAWFSTAFLYLALFAILLIFAFSKGWKIA